MVSTSALLEQSRAYQGRSALPRGTLSVTYVRALTKVTFHGQSQLSIQEAERKQAHLHF